ncbi:helix-turn-helix domain-containing protein [uncultured Corynebacterium sp.]|uniref:helix-turn-helix transcriptional regulator n=1 Tax=uncultured Corynebacterium sp. TaxID=159447 RepID=UPI00259BABFE|nr:helix-turn-helix domain-containing protein [uncultured Corynebacterium sp.]
MNTPTVSIPVAAALLGISRSSAYEAARKGNFPSRVIKINGRYVVPTKPLLDALGLDELPATA